ncbi:MAG: hypothetical protein HKN43_06475 [Rhodothermales bacterium]|nr:hypothetical protein [Rhodothermales bacterium]
MKYFTKEWHGGGWNGYQLEQTRDAYFRRLEAIKLTFPQDVSRLATEVDLQSGLIRKVRYRNHRPWSLQILLRCGGVFQGYQDLDLEYNNVIVSEEDLVSLEMLADIDRVEMLVDEVDFGPPGKYVHRILFSDYDDIEIGFGSVSIKKSRSSRRSFEKDPVPFAIVPAFTS